MPFIGRAGRHLRANVVAYLALFVALGGTGAYAANTIGSSDVIDESLLSQDIKNGQVRGGDLGGDAVSSAKIKAGGVATTDLADDAVTPAKLSAAPSASVLRLSPEVTHSTQGATLHPDFEVFDTQGLHDGASEFLTAPVDGTYVVSASVQWDANSSGYRNTGLYGPSGTFAVAIGAPTAAPGVTVQNVSGVERLAAGQSVHIECLQGSGGDLNARVSRFAMTLVGGY